jgi:pyruvate formate lyase activating enzyme
MKLGGLQKVTLIDYPGEVAATIFTNGCNFFCPYCHNSQLVKENEYDITVADVFDYLIKRKSKLSGVCITGGEPTIQNDLVSFIEKIKDLGYKVKLDTNGSNYEMLKELIDKELIDYVAMDIKTNIEKYPSMAPKNIISNIKESIILIQSSNIEYEFRTTVVPGLHDKNIMKDISKLLEGSKKYYIQNFKPGNSLDKEFDNKRTFTGNELQEFKSILDKYIDNVEIRN